MADFQCIICVFCFWLWHLEANVVDGLIEIFPISALARPFMQNLLNNHTALTWEVKFKIYKIFFFLQPIPFLFLTHIFFNHSLFIIVILSLFISFCFCIISLAIADHGPELWVLKPKDHCIKILSAKFESCNIVKDPEAF